jgi:hypothetical protein
LTARTGFHIPDAKEFRRLLAKPSLMPSLLRNGPARLSLLACAITHECLQQRLKIRYGPLQTLHVVRMEIANSKVGGRQMENLRLID